MAAAKSLSIIATVWASVALLFTCSAVALNVRVAFVEEATCPTASAGDGVRQMAGVADQRTCLVECSLWAQCVAVHYSASAATCQLGTLAAWLRLWQAGSCKSSVRPPPIPDSVATKLLAFYNFRFSLSNQLNASAFPVTPSKASRTRQGLQMLGAFDSNALVSLENRGLDAYLVSRQLTFFIKVTTEFDFELRCFHRVFNRSVGMADGATGRWCRNAGRAVFMQRDFARRQFTSGGEFLPTGFLPSTFSTAVAMSFDSTAAAAASVAFYFNGTVDTQAATFVNDTGTVLGSDGLAIGYDNVYPFKGQVHCYGIATSVLTLPEVQQLETLC